MSQQKDNFHPAQSDFLREHEEYAKNGSHHPLADHPVFFPQESGTQYRDRIRQQQQQQAGESENLELDR